MNPLEKRWLCAAGMVAPSIPVGWLSVAGQMAQQSPEYSYCVKNSKSIKIEQFVEWFKDDFGGMGVHVLRLVSYTIELVLFGYLIPFAYHFVRASYMGKAASPAVGIPMWIVQSITVISFGLCEIRLLQKLISRIGMIRRGEKEKKGEE